MLSRTEAVWRHLLVEALDQGNRRTSVTALSHTLGLPVSTVHKALERPRAIGAIRGTASGLRVLDPQRLLLLWAAHRDLAKDVVYQTHAAAGVHDIESRLPPTAIPTAYTAYVHRAGRNTVADYDQVVTYADPKEVAALFR